MTTSTQVLNFLDDNSENLTKQEYKNCLESILTGIESRLDCVKEELEEEDKEQNG
ncbi:MAG: hypothetical protein H7282_04850 [Cytophagaceae bacterium]|nr:hypothetical protein [Cytophagaceae bacterium]